jgi:hypothetical protein
MNRERFLGVLKNCFLYGSIDGMHGDEHGIFDMPKCD